MSATINMKITAAGQAALFNAQNTGFNLDLTHIQFGAGNRVVDGSEESLVDAKQVATISGGRKVSLTQLRVSALFSGADIEAPYEVSEIGVWSGVPGAEGSALFAYWSEEEGHIAVMSVGVDFAWTHDLFVDAAVGGAVNIVVDPSASTAVALLSDHEADPDPHPQYATAVYLRDNYPKIYSILELPAENVGPIIVVEAAEVWLWSVSQYFTGYRSPLCGRPLDGHTTVPLASEIDAVGGTLSKTAYAALWGYAQENGLVIPSGQWVAGMHKFVDLGGGGFRCPDLRNQFRRYTGTDADTANARTLGSSQLDAMQTVSGNIGIVMVSGSQTGPFSSSDQGPTISFTGEAGGNRQKLMDFSLGRMARVSTENRPTNTAYAPRIHV